MLPDLWALPLFLSSTHSQSSAKSPIPSLFREHHLHLHSNWSPGKPSPAALSSRDCVSPQFASHRPGRSVDTLALPSNFTPLLAGPLNAPMWRPTPSDLTVNPPFSQAIHLTHIPDSLSILGLFTAICSQATNSRSWILVIKSMTDDPSNALTSCSLTLSWFLPHPMGKPWAIITTIPWHSTPNLFRPALEIPSTKLNHSLVKSDCLLTPGLQLPSRMGLQEQPHHQTAARSYFSHHFSHLFHHSEVRQDIPHQLATPHFQLHPLSYSLGWKFSKQFTPFFLLKPSTPSTAPALHAFLNTAANAILLKTAWWSHFFAQTGHPLKESHSPRAQVQVLLLTSRTSTICPPPWPCDCTLPCSLCLPCFSESIKRATW